jgi:hypothetical protein
MDFLLILGLTKGVNKGFFKIHAGNFMNIKFTCELFGFKILGCLLCHSISKILVNYRITFHNQWFLPKKITI